MHSVIGSLEARQHLHLVPISKDHDRKLRHGARQHAMIGLFVRKGLEPCRVRPLGRTQTGYVQALFHSVSLPRPTFLGHAMLHLDRDAAQAFLGPSA